MVAPFTEQGLAAFDAVLAGFVEDGSEPGIVAALRRGSQTHVTVVGNTAFGGDRPMQRDTLFRIASNTKPFTAVVTMSLIEDGSLELDQPIDAFVPELANRMVLRDPSGQIDDVVPARRSITVEDLLTFRMGLGEFLEDWPISRAFAEVMETEDGRSLLPPDRWVDRLSQLPLASQPGEAWYYHTSSQLLGVLIARVTGRSFGEVLAERVLEPLGLADTGFQISPAQADRLCEAYKDDDAADRPVVWDSAKDSMFARPPVFEDGGGGLVSSLDDLLRFSSMMMNGGQIDGQALLSAESHRLMTTNHLSASQIQGGGMVLDGKGWGYCQEVSIPGNAHPGRYGWYGGYGTVALNDPVQDLTMILLTQRSFGPESTFRLIEEWEAAVYAALA